MAAKEAQARIKINKLLEEGGWRFFDDAHGKANIQLEANVKLDSLGDNFETTNGFVDFLLLDERGRPVVVLEAKSEDKNPLAGKEQARKYARGHCCNFVILSNGNLHYLWDLRQGNPELIVRFTAEIAKTHAESEFEKYRVVQDGLFESDFDRLVKQIAWNDQDGDE
jgi:type I restriction enzyme R subunit